MIVRMKKVAVITQAKDANSAVGELRRLGVLHVEHQHPPAGKDIAIIHEDLALANEALGILSQKELAAIEPRQIDSRTFLDRRHCARHVIDLYKRIDQLKEYSRGIILSIAQWEQWGDFAPGEIERLRENNIYLRLYQVPEKQLKDFYERSFGKIEREIKDASLEYNQDTGLFEIMKEQNGYKLNNGKLRSDLFESAGRLVSQNISIEIIENAPRVNESGAMGAQKKANAILSRAPFTLVYLNPINQNGSAKPQEYKLDKDQLKEMMVFKQKENSSELKAGLNETGLKNFLIEISPSINQKPENAALTMKNGKVTAVVLYPSMLE